MEILGQHTIRSCCLLTGGDRDRMTANHESYLLMASTQNDMEDWVKAIRRVIWGPFGGGEYHLKPLRCRKRLCQLMLLSTLIFRWMSSKIYTN